jgi:hypothetical protein
MLGEFIHNGKLFSIKRPHEKIAEDEVRWTFNTLKDAEFFFRYAFADPFTRKEITDITKYYLPFACQQINKCPEHVEEQRLVLLMNELVKGEVILIQKKIITMTNKEKEDCSKIYKIYTDIEIEPFRWNKGAADLLGEMVRIIEDCTRVLSTLKALVPKDLPSKGSWIWLAEIVLEIIENEVKIRRGYVNNVCFQNAVESYRGLIEAEMI